MIKYKNTKELIIKLKKFKVFFKIQVGFFNISFKFNITFLNINLKYQLAFKKR